MSGDASGAIGNKFFFDSGASGGTCINAAGTNNHIVSNLCENVNGNGIVMTSGAARSIATGNTIALVGGNGNGIDVSGNNQIVSNNWINQSFLGKTIGIKINQRGAFVGGNTINMAANDANFTNNQTCMTYNANSQVRVIGNYCLAGWRGFDMQGTGTGSFANVVISNNRYVGGSGAAFAAGGAGVFIGGNYVNNGGLGARATMVCDSSCSAGNGRGKLCNQDSDCSTCNASVQKCIPEALVGYIGDPAGTNPSAAAGHNSWFGNVAFAGHGSIKQCTNGVGTATNPGALCETAGNSCGGGGTCTATGGLGVIATCVGGTEAGKACCLSSGGAPTCAVRTPTPLIRFPDYGSATGMNNINIQDNTFFGAASNDSMIGIDCVSSASLGNISFYTSNISSNIFDMITATNSTAIKFPTTVGATFSDLVIGNNEYSGFNTDVANWKGIYGSVAYAPKAIRLPGDMTTSSTGFTNITDGTTPVQVALRENRSYVFRCDLIYTTAATTTGIAFAMTGPTSPTTFTYTVRLCDEVNNCTTAATNNMKWQVGSGDDATGTATTDTPNTGNNYATIEGVLNNGANAGNLTARVKAEVAANVTVKAGSACVATQFPGG
jgi:hypothetical protein